MQIIFLFSLKLKRFFHNLLNLTNFMLLCLIVHQRQRNPLPLCESIAACRQYYSILSPAREGARLGPSPDPGIAIGPIKASCGINSISTCGFVYICLFIAYYVSNLLQRYGKFLTYANFCRIFCNFFVILLIFRLHQIAFRHEECKRDH